MPPQNTGSANMGAMEIDFLLPNGFIVKLACDINSTLGELRTPLWEKAVELPAAHLLHNKDAYAFIGVTKDAEEVEYDDSSHIKDLHLLFPVIEVSKSKELRDSRRLHIQAAEAMGIKIETIDSMGDQELQRFRKDIRQMCWLAVNSRERWSREEQARFHHPPIIDINPDLPMNVVKHFEQRNNTMKIRIWGDNSGQSSFCDIQVEPTCLPSDVISRAVDVDCRQRSLSQSRTTNFVLSSTQKYVLNVRGKQEYMLRECCIHMYKYIRDCISQNTTPELVLVDRESLFRQLPDNRCLALRTESLPPEPQLLESVKSSWELPDEKYTIKVFNMPVRKINHPDLSEWFVQAQLFHGITPLSRAISTLDCGFNQSLDFDITIQNIPRCARLCFTICASGRTGKKGRSRVAVYWVNMQVFDYKGHLVTGEQSLGVWQFPEYSSTKYPQGTPGGNTDPNCQPLRFTVVHPRRCGNDLIVFPSKDIDETIKREEQFLEYTHEPVSFEKLDKIMAIDPVSELSPEYKKFLWQNRWLAKEYAPNILPRLLQCVNWKDRSAVFELYTIMKKWPKDELTLSTVLQLLNCHYPDTRVRSLAVWCLDKQITDQLLELFLLQLVQNRPELWNGVVRLMVEMYKCTSCAVTSPKMGPNAVKFESYIHNELSRYLLYKALLDKTIGHTFFWLLRSELHNPASRQRFAPILEAYCTYCGRAVLSRRLQDVRVFNKKGEIAVTIKTQNSLPSQNAYIQKLLNEESSNILSGASCVFDQTIELGELIPERCSVLCSKKRPLWLTWKNKQQNAENTDTENMSFIFKHGDDLRQDMMVLRLITVMDMIWKYSCHDYRLVKYGCLAMGEEIGMIEVVKNAKTVNDVRNAFNAYALNEWLHNENRERYSEAVKTFTYSCAGYCVASFILGLKDRHPDNIMVTKRGQVFHIDFGHITNHSKRKMGINREPVPFILTTEFIQVITRGKPDPTNTHEFRQFVYLCYEAYMQLRRYSGLLLTLLSLMMQSNLPELSTRADIDAIRNALAIDRSEGEATRYFLTKVEESYGGSWTTQIDWFLHDFNMLIKKGTTSS